MNQPDQSRQQAVFEQLRQGILAGSLPGGARLPATRPLAKELGVARQTVVVAYERLAAEGYTTARIGSGTFVSRDLPDALPPRGQPAEGGDEVLSGRGQALAGTAISAHAGLASGLLAPGVPAAELFPAAAWAKSAVRVLRAMPAGLSGYPEPQGLPALRQEISAHLAATRGLIADPERIVVTAGTQQALRVAAELLLDPGDSAWVEDPGYIAGRGALLAAGARLVAVPSDAEGLDVAEGVARAPDARLVLVAPSHATPRGSALPVGRRLALLDWAAQAGAWVLEDDCDAEFRWDGRPLPPLAGLDRMGRVIYCGTFSKTLAPGLRLGFAVVPHALVQPFVRARTLFDRGPPGLSQAVLADFMGHDLLAPHIRRMRTEYGRRRDAVLQALAAECPGIQVPAAPGGLHMVGLLPAGVDEAAICAAGRRLGLAVAPLGAYFVSGRRPVAQAPGLVMGFAGTPASRAGQAARWLNRAIGMPS